MLLEKFGDRSIKIGSPQNNEAIETDNKVTLLCSPISINEKDLEYFGILTICKLSFLPWPKNTYKFK